MSALPRSLVALLAAIALGVACATTPKPEATSTISVEEAPDAGAAAQPALQPVTAPEGFTVALPANPQVQRNTVKIPAGEVNVSNWNARDESGVVYSVTTADYPTSLVEKTTAETFLSEGRQAVVQQLTNAKVVSEEATSLQGYPGTSYVVQSDNGELRGRNFLVGNRLYTLITLYNPAIGAPNADAFFGSLQFINPPPPVAKGSAGAADGGTAAPRPTTPGTGTTAGTPDGGTAR